MKRSVGLGLTVLLMVSGTVLAQNAPPSSAAIASLLKPSAGPSPSAGVVSMAISAGANNQKLVSTPGTTNSVYAFFTMLYYADYGGEHASVQVASSTPTLYALMGFNPEAHLFLVKLKINTKHHNRSVKIGHAKFAGYAGIRVPDPDWTIPFTAKNVGPGEWSITPSKPLQPGEYGLFVPKGTPASGPNHNDGGSLYGFTVVNAPATGSSAQ